ncbi:MAG: hypothetical protein FWC85_01650 [Elusimicrobia bacterium]|nr:hypothetical protein [Elusimicrobiota bacterium]
MKKIFILLLSLLLLSNNAYLFAQNRQDVRDPVLAEIIRALSPKMPRFINQFGPNVFVANEPITRATLLAALYEFDVYTRAAQAGTAVSAISRTEFDALRTRLANLERAPAGTATAAAPARIDGVMLVNELEPNMPMLLDNTLRRSRVFQNLEAQIAAGATAGAPARTDGLTYAYVAQNFSEMERRIHALNQRIDVLMAQAPGTPGHTVAAVPPGAIDQQQMRDINARIADITRTMAQVDELDRSRRNTEQEIRRIERQLNTMERRGARTATADYDDNGAGAATIAKISLGITMVAALFVAR